MLTLQECEALAAAYPEMARHYPDAGDLFWDHDPEDTAPYWMAVGRGKEVGGVGFDSGLRGDGAEEIMAGVWCPRLDQLLVLAKAATRHFIRLEAYQGGWRCGSYIWVESDDLECAPGPDQAVAAWLLAKAKKRDAS